MKFLRYIILPVAALALLAGCTELDKVVAPDPAGAKAPVLTVVPSSVVITLDNQKTGNALCEWTPADYGFAAAPVYSIMMSIGGGEPVELTAAQGSSVEVSYELLNGRAIVAGAQVVNPPDEPFANAVTYTIVSTMVAGFGTPLTSAAKTGTIVAYLPPPKYLWMAGNFVSPTWNPGDPAAPRLTSPAPGRNFEGMVDLTSDSALEFKFCATPDWNNDYGGTLGALVPKGGNITDLESGYYYMTVDEAITRVISNLKIATIGAIGNGVPGEWGSETKMTYDKATNTWTIASIPMTNGGEFKLRINDDWGNALGGALDNAGFSGGNIPVAVPTGNYKMVLHAGEVPFRIELTAL
jgi:hypothetical protein